MKAINIIWDTDGEDISLPTEIDIPEEMEDEDELENYLSEVTGFCHKGFDLCWPCGSLPKKIIKKEEDKHVYSSNNNKA